MTAEAAGAPARPRLGVPTKILYGLGAAAFGIKDNGFRVFLVFFYNQVIGLPALDVSFAVLIALVIDSFVDPIVGQVSDNWRSKWGRRHPFMYAAALPVAVSYLALWNPPQGLPHGLTLLYLIVTAVLTRSFITMFEIPSSAMAAELTDDYDARTSLISYRVLFAWWGGLTLQVFALLVLFKGVAGHDGRLNHASYGNYAVIASALMFLFILISAAGTHHFIPAMRAPPKERPAGIIETFRQMLATLSNRPFLMIAMVALFAAAAEGVGFAIYFYMVTYFWHLTTPQVAILATSAYFGSLLAFIIAPILSRLSGKKSAAIVLLIVTVALSAAPLILKIAGLFWPLGSPQLIPTLYVIDVVRGAVGITCSILIVAMIADVVEDSQLATGRRSEGLFFAAIGFISKSVSGVGAVILGLILTVIHFPVGMAPAKAPVETSNKLALAYLPVLVIVYGIALCFIFFYRITRESHAETLAKLRAMEAAAEGAGPPAV